MSSLESIFAQCLHYENTGNKKDYVILSMQAVTDGVYNFNLFRVGVIHHFEAGNFSECIKFCDKAIVKLNLTGLEKDLATTIKSICYFIGGNLSKLRHSLASLNNILEGNLNTKEELTLNAILQIYARYLIQLQSWKAENPQFYSKSELPLISLIGDSNCLAPAWTVIKLCGTQYKIKPHLIIGTKAWDIATKNSYTRNLGLEKAISNLKQNDSAIFCFGEIDTRINEGIHKKSKDDIDNNISFIVSNYVTTIKSLCLAKNITPIFCGVQAPSQKFFGYYAKNYSNQELEDYLEIPRIFNHKLKTMVGAENFIDLYKITADSKGVGKEEFFIDNAHLLPNILQLALES